MEAVQSLLAGADWGPVRGFGGRAMSANLEGSGRREDGQGQIGGEGVSGSGST